MLFQLTRLAYHQTSQPNKTSLDSICLFTKQTPKKNQNQYKNYFQKVVESGPTSVISEIIPDPPNNLESSLTPEQVAWLNEMTAIYGSEFQRKEWVQSLIAQNQEAYEASQQKWNEENFVPPLPPGTPPPTTGYYTK